MQTKITHIISNYRSAKYGNGATDSTTDDHDDSDEEDGSSEEGNIYIS